MEQERQDSGCDEMSEQDTEQSESGKKKITRVRLASPRKQLEKTIQKMTKASETPMRPEKMVDLLLGMSELQVKLLDLDREDKYEKLEVEHAELSAQHAVSAQRIQELETEKQRLSNHRCQVTVLREQDPEAAVIREQNAGLQNILKSLATTLDIDARARLAIQVMRSSPEHVARTVLPLLGFDYATYWQMMQYSEQKLLEVLERADEQATGNLVVFARAALAVVHGVNVSRKPKKKEFDPAVLGTLENRLAEVRAQREALEAQRT